MAYGRDQKYRVRQRFLYALRFKRAVNIGQTVDPSRRENEHRAKAGGWKGQDFSFHLLGSMQGTEADAVDMEHAWRYVAAGQGLRVYGLPPNVPVRPWRQMNRRRYAMARQLEWPRALGHRSPRLAWLRSIWFWLVLAFVAWWVLVR